MKTLGGCLVLGIMLGGGGLLAQLPPEETGVRAGGVSMACRPGQPVRLVFAGIEAEVPVPLRVGILDTRGQTRWLEGSYSSVTRDAATLRCAGEVRTPTGSVFRVTDAYSAGPTGDGVVFARSVAVVNSALGDVGFMTRFGMRWAAPTLLRDCEGFMPGVWYQDNHAVPRHALAANLAEERIWVREDRLPWPLVMLRRRNDGASLTLMHLQPDGSTAPQDVQPGTVVDARLQFAALGVTSPAQPELTVVFPGTEADRTYLRMGRQRQTTKELARFHPIQPGVRHQYQALLTAARQPGFAPAMRWAWRTAYAQARPAAAPVNLPAVYEASLRLLDNVAGEHNGAPGLPFCIHLPKGGFERTVKDVSFQMGFVGQQLPAAYHLMRYGTLRNRPEAVRKGEAIVDFWSAQSLTPEGLPRTWYDPYPQPHWRDYHTFLRVASDGMNGALQAWDFARQSKRDRPEWLRFCRRFGDWLLAHQNPDGSWFREYDFGSRAASDGKQNTSHPIRFLVDLAAATGERRYAEAALRAGEYCFANTHGSFAYIGGTADNPNVIDKEAGFMALDAFLALHDLTGEARWLAAAAQAADFMETWVYIWSVPPLPGATARGSLPARLPMSGWSLIATGHSGSDLFMAGAAFLYQRLYVATGDGHYLDVARLLLNNPRQFVDVNGSLGYGQPGLCTEALSLAIPRDGGVNVWLPWLSVSIVEPMVRLEETFGAMTLGAGADAGQLEALRVRDAKFARPRAAAWTR